MKKINIFFDIKVLIDAFFVKDGGRSGVYFVAWNVLNIMQKNEDFKIMLAYSLEYENSVSLKKIKEVPFFSQFEFVCAGVTSEIMQKIETHKKNKNYMKIIYNYLRLAKLKLKERFYCNEESFKNTQIYLSPYYAIPQKILKQKHIKKIYVLYDTIPIMFQEYFNANVGYNQMLNTLNKDIYSFCISQSCKDDFLKYYGDSLDSNKMFVTHIAANQNYIPIYDRQELALVLKKYNVEHGLNDKYLFSLCTLEPRKNLPFTIACFLKFIKKHNVQDLYFYLGGSAWKNFEAVMAETLKEAGEYKYKIKLLGYIDDSDVNILYSNSLFFTYLSQYEGFGMPPLEAMQAGTPVITSNNSSLPEVVGDAAVSLAYNDEDAVIKAFENFYFNEELRKEYIAKGLERAKMFSWEKCAQQMMEVMKNVCK
jgi:glycosyltransferase involved in cell wall biosynthesis